MRLFKESWLWLALPMLSAVLLTLIASACGAAWARDLLDALLPDETWKGCTYSI